MIPTLDQHRKDVHDIRIGQLKESMRGVADRYEELINIIEAEIKWHEKIEADPRAVLKDAKGE